MGGPGSGRKKGSGGGKSRDGSTGIKRIAKLTKGEKAATLKRASELKKKGMGAEAYILRRAVKQSK